MDEKLAKARAYSCACEKCIAACNWTPGHFLPGEAEAAAEALGVDFETFARRFLVLNYWGTGEDTGPVWAWRPRKENDLASGVASFGYAPGRCAFLDKQDRCSIYAQRPAECASALCCGKREQVEEYNKEGVFNAWRAAGNPLAPRANSVELMTAVLAESAGSAVLIWPIDAILDAGLAPPMSAFIDAMMMGMELTAHAQAHADEQAAEGDGE
jgi:hypothetical protein